MLLNIHERFLLMVELGICLTLWIMTLIQLRRLREKCPNTEYLSVFCPNAGKYGPEKNF